MDSKASANADNHNGYYLRRKNHKNNSKVKFRDENGPPEKHDHETRSNGSDHGSSGSSNTSVKRSPHKLSDYVVALRPWSFTATLMPVALGSVLYVKYSGASMPCIWTLIASCLTVLSVHAAGNLVNTYMDYKKGVDSQKSDDRTLVDHILEQNDVATMATICYFLACIGFGITVFLSPSALEDLAFIFFGGLSSSFLYTGGFGLKYIALGDILIFLTFGPITVLFTYISQGGQISVLPLLYAIPLALNTEAILHSNNTRDMVTDKKSGIVTLAIMLGKTGSYVYFVLLLFMPYCIFTFFVINFSRVFLFPMLTITLAFSYEREFRNGHLAKMPQKMALLNFLMGLSYVAAVVLTPQSSLPGF